MSSYDRREILRRHYISDARAERRAFRELENARRALSMSARRWSREVEGSDRNLAIRLLNESLTFNPVSKFSLQALNRLTLTRELHVDTSR